MNRKPGDWNCRSCQHLNFSWRDSCQLCSDPRSDGMGGGGDARSDYGGFGGGRGGSSFGFSGSDVRPGDWYCQCGYHNFASRSNCFKCSGFKDESAAVTGGWGFDGSRGVSFGSAGGGRAAGWKSGDWICNRSGCNEHNFASRMECFRCNAPRDSGTEV
ncbi:putative zinc finger protein30 isoform X2 [Iris pallida]|uniref:Zinc finger protein30 isoform X2 n=1 Tax=Iris pallida TaxID=29817 RepID=A0AAX6GM22_IRIPA|nr:putative zinc finger protein30 isoform X2 [Iris pallida]